MKRSLVCLWLLCVMPACDALQHATLGDLPVDAGAVRDDDDDRDEVADAALIGPPDAMAPPEPMDPSAPDASLDASAPNDAAAHDAAVDAPVDQHCVREPWECPDR